MTADLGLLAFSTLSVSAPLSLAPLQQPYPATVAGLLLALVLEVAPSAPVPPACFTLAQRLPNSENVLSPKSPALNATVSLTSS